MAEKFNNLNFNENIKALRKASGISQKSLADAVGLKRGSISSYEDGRAEPSFENLQKIAEYFNVDLDSLIKGNLKGNLKGNPLEEKQNDKYIDKRKKVTLVSEEDRAAYYRGDQVRPIVATVNEEGRENIVMVDTKAQAGYPQHHLETEFLQDLPAFTLPTGDFRNATFRAFEVAGDSMHDTLYPGDILISKYIENWLRDTLEGYIHVIVTEESVQVKRLLNRIERSNKVILQSDNPQYPPDQIEAEHIKEIWLVKARITKYMPNKRQENERKIQELEKSLIELREEFTDFKNRF